MKKKMILSNYKLYIEHTFGLICIKKTQQFLNLFRKQVIGCTIIIDNICYMDYLRYIGTNVRN